ncbi:50S ribosomal protein L17 [Patescibacteria group bacterium]|nr:MAG: 50S ribosomal protein L17 [Patescibacteria group bacterium]
MRHQKKKVTLDRKTAARRSLLANLAVSVILYEKVKTTKAKAKAVRPLVEKLITESKKQNLAARREIEGALYGSRAARKLMSELASRYKERVGGYTRVTALGERKGDAAQAAIIELV